VAARAGTDPSAGPDGGPARSAGEPTGHLPPRRSSGTPNWVYLVAVAIVLVVLLGGFLYVFVLPARHSDSTPSGSGVVLVPSGHDYDVFVSQSSIISFTLNGTTTLSGAFTTTYGITAYVLTNQEYASYSHYGNVSAYEWSSGEVSSGTISESLPAGSWNLAFIDVTSQATSVLITSPIALTPT
jgi:hypothetical protein